ncbi:flagellar hook-associated protein FlgK [Ferrovibrio sp.]|uniref:flagellar hook-associated protein FlgK n=1 Tax=Ferrovibrio sp. TaxID=1917215 RepID=UPI0025C43AAB|nr:flagellar hook-associated protein FlgK [Ferrovibrio sp.]MBX3453042.1 flagellar hook-associated protein FlgK [Ferrovibrio sp.]
MSLSAALSTSVSALAAFQTQTRLLSANVGNAQNENYTRKVATLTTPGIDGLPGAPLISTITRVAAKDVQQDHYNALSDYGRLKTATDLTQGLADIIDATNTDGSQPELAALLSRFEDSWKTLEANPESAAAAENAIRRGQDLVLKINQLNARQTELRTRADEQAEAAVQTINTASVEIQKLNVQITAALGAGQPTGDLEDLRDQQVRRIADLVDVRVLTNDRGELSVYTTGGIQISGTVAQQFTYNRSSTTTAGTITYQGSTNSLNSGILNGSLRAALDYLDPTDAALNSTDPNVGTLAKYANQLDAFAYNLVTLVNNAYAGAENRVPAPTPAEGTEFFTAFTAAETGFEAQSLTINADLLTGAASLKVLAAGPIQQAMRTTLITAADINRSGVTDNTGGAQSNGLAINNVNLFGLVDGIMAYTARATDVNQVNRDSAERVEHTLDQKYRNLTGVDIDTELATLQVLQNNYAAMANVLNAITRMFDEVITIGR